MQVEYAVFVFCTRPRAENEARIKELTFSRIRSMLFKVRFEGPPRTILDISIGATRIDRPSHTLINIVHTRRITLFVNMGEQNASYLIQLFVTNDHGFCHDPPCYVLAWWLGDAAVIAIEKDCRHEFKRVGIKSTIPQISRRIV
mmetsp:Transcript_81107/g.121911  ORF Transcript_81107/g.121911 Transcript_81107/m.121911 type:complete len:144 (-) Transcript_81107:579-1010(-)